MIEGSPEEGAGPGQRQTANGGGGAPKMSPQFRSYAAHAVVERWATAASNAGLPLEMVSFSELETGSWRRLPLLVRNLFNPLRARAHLVQAARRSRLVLLRDFLTVPFALWAPLLRNVAQRIALVTHHNLQRAATRRRDHAGLERLLALGFRLIVPESGAGLSALSRSVDERQVLVLPFGLSAPALQRRRECVVVSVLGADREEKGGADTVARVAGALGRRSVTLRVASRSQERLAIARREGWSTVDTTSAQAWESTLAESAVVVIDYRRESYYFRPSATVSDAATAGAAVVVPDFPVLREQVTTPLPVGATFGQEHSLGAALEVALRLGTGSEEPFSRYRAYRSPESIARKLRGFLDAQG